MNRRVFSLLSGLMFGLSISLAFAGELPSAEDAFDRMQYGAKYYDEFRQVTYWGAARVSIYNVDLESEDAEFLKLLTKGKSKYFSSERADFQDHLLKEVKRLFGEVPYHDTDAGRKERLEKFTGERGGWDDFNIEEFEALEEARRKALHGGRAGFIGCQVQVKRRRFPVLYQIECVVSEKLGLGSWYSSLKEIDLGFSSPEFIDREIKNTMTDLLTKLKGKWSKIRKYGKK